MKTISELRTVLKFHPEPVNSWLKILIQKKIDFDVFLPSRNMNLQRDYVWDIHQKRELIWSILMNRHIPRLAMINVIVDELDTEGVYQVIDGKQRLSTMFDFYNNNFTLKIDNELYFYKDLPADYQNVIGCYPIPYLIVNEYFGETIDDDDKINWFKYINFAGTPHDLEYIEKLK